LLKTAWRLNNHLMKQVEGGIKSIMPGCQEKCW